MISERYLRRLKSYCCGDITEIENYEDAIADTSQKWHCHHRKELTEDGKYQYSMEDLIEKGLYYDRPSSELIFLTPSEHMSLHAKARKGCKNPFYGKVHSDATKENMSKSQKGNRYALKHHDITVSQLDDPNAYQRALYHKNKDEVNAKRRERYHKKKALAAK